jgi:hypothetical protein
MRRSGLGRRASSGDGPGYHCDPEVAAANLRTLAPGVRQVEALAAELVAEQAEFDEAMDLVALKKLTRGVRSVRVR